MMSTVMNLAKGMDTVMLIRHLVVVRLVQVVVVIAGKSSFFTANSDAYAMRFSLVGPDTRDEASVRDLAPCRDITAPHEKNCVCAGWHASAESLS